jgi:hypothetical protein
VALLKERKAVPAAEPKGSTQPRFRPTRSTSIIIGVFVLVSVALNVKILMTPGIPVHGDLTYPTSLENFIDNYVFLFNDHGSISNLESVDRALTLLPLAYIAQLFGLGTDFLHKVVYLVLPLLSFVSMMVLARHILERTKPEYIRPAVLIPSGLIYGLSPWAMEQLPAILFWLAYALTPLMIMLTLRLIEKARIRDALWLAFVLSLIASTPQYLAYSAVIVLASAITELIRRFRGDTAIGKQLRELAPGLLAFSVAFIALNFYWLYPIFELMRSGRPLSPGYAVDSTMTAMFSANSSPLNVLRGYDQWIRWYALDPGLSLLTNRLWIFNSLVLPTIAFAAFLKSDIRRSRHVRLLAFLGLAFALFALGTTTSLYDWLVFRVPVVRSFGWIFRVPGKLSYVLWVFYALMAAVLVGRLLEARLARTLRIIVLGLLAVSTTVLIAPKAIAYFFHYYVPTEIPSDYDRLTSFLDTQETGDTRALYLAPYDFGLGKNSLGYEASFTWNPRRLAAASPAISSPIPSIGYYHLTYRDWQAALYPSIYRRIPPDIGRTHLSIAGVKFLIYHADIVGGEARADRDLTKLMESDLLHVRTFGDIHVFENPFVLRTVRPADPLTNISVTKMDPTKYEVSIEDAAAPTRIVLAQPYDPSWVLRANGQIIGPEVAGPTTVEFPVPAGVTDATIEYFPQRYYRLGLMVTFGAILLMGLGLAARTIGSRAGPKLKDRFDSRRSAPPPTD